MPSNDAPDAPSAPGPIDFPGTDDLTGIGRPKWTAEAVDAATTAGSGRDAQGLPTGRLAGRTDFAGAVRDALAQAAAAGWREMMWADPSFEDWPLGERAVIEVLNAWAGSGRRLTMLACSYDEVVRRHARFVAWRGTWAHIIECRAVATSDPAEVPSALWSPSWAMRRLDTLHSTGFAGTEPDRRLQVQELLRHWLDKSRPAFPATTLGL